MIIIESWFKKHSLQYSNQTFLQEFKSNPCLSNRSICRQKDGLARSSSRFSFYPSARVITFVSQEIVREFQINTTFGNSKTKKRVLFIQSAHLEWSIEQITKKRMKSSPALISGSQHLCISMSAQIVDVYLISQPGLLQIKSTSIG